MRRATSSADTALDFVPVDRFMALPRDFRAVAWFPDHAPPEVMAERAAALRAAPPAAWDGVYVKTTK